MRAVVPDEWIAERERLGLDGKDEMWDGVLHMVPPASSAHGRFGSGLGGVLGRLAEQRGLWPINEPGVFDPEVGDLTSYRVPDLGYARPEDVSDRGIEGSATLVVEVLSPGDSSYEKLPFYRRVGVNELLFVDPRSKVFEVRVPQGDGWSLVPPDKEGWTPLVSLDVLLRTESGRLQVRHAGGLDEV